jgi:hypothetical protein
MLVDGHDACVNDLFVAASGSMMIVPNLGIGMNPALVGFPGALTPGPAALGTGRT